MQFDLNCIDWHWHPEFEFVYVEKGCATLFAGNSKHTLTAGSAVFINKQVVHRFEARESTIIPNIVFSPLLLASEDSVIHQKYIEPIFSSSIDCQIFAPGIPWQEEIIHILNAVFSLQQQDNPCELQTVRLLLELWQIMHEHMTLSFAEQCNATSFQDRARLQMMLQYIHENYQCGITLEKLSELICLSKSSILKLFKSYLHMTPIDYVLHYKLKRAAHLLDTTENTVYSIAQNTGFDNTGYFCRKFKDIFELTPSQYRNLKRQYDSN